MCLASLAAGCGGPQVVRGEQVEGLDREAFGTGLDRYDLQKLLHENMVALDQSRLVRERWASEKHPAVAVLPFRNETTEHVDSALEALISDIETNLINAGQVRVISRENQPGLMDEIRRQSAGGFNPERVAQWGRQVGARYFVTGKVFSTDERFDEERRVQYFMYLQVLDAETSDILFQHKSALTKAIIH